MRKSILLLMLIATIATAAGCSRSPSRPASDLQKSFGLRLNWPGEPHESNQDLPSKEGVWKNYMGTFTERGQDEVVIFSAYVMELPTLEQSSPKDLFEASVLPMQRDEFTRKDIEHGPKKYPGVDITRHSKKSFSRNVQVMAGLRIYNISVTCHKEKSLESAKVRDFFDSFGIDE
jgi:hypothetical protein